MRMKNTVSLVLFGVLDLVTVSLATEGTWTYKADMTTARSFFSGEIVDGKIYVIGGAPSGSSVLSTVEMYDPMADTWTRMANMPSARCGHKTCTLDGKIYVFGGNSPTMWSTAKKNVYVYDPQTNTWTQKADMPYAIGGCGIAVVDSTIYLIGGTLSASSPPVHTVMAYNPVTESWTQKADMPTARYSLCACVVDGEIYAVGGCTENWQALSYKHVEVYDPSTDTWTHKSDMPTERWGLGTCVVNGRIYATGGWLHGDACTTNEVYDPITDTWTTKSPMQQRRAEHAACLLGDKIYAIGGIYQVPQSPILSTMEEYDTGLTAPQPDFNGDGLVNIKDLLRLIESWGQDDPLVDMAPWPFGDGTVDALDLEVLMSYWEQAVDDPTLLAHWALDETEGTVAYDSAGVNDDLLIGGPIWQPEGGEVGGALVFDGIDDCVFAQYGLDPAGGPFSILAWVQGGAPGQVVISQLNGANWLQADSASGCLMTELCASGRNGGPLKSETAIGDGAWHRIGFVWDGIYRTLYVDDILAAEDTQQGLNSSISGLNIGCGTSSTAGTFWFGPIDEVRIYSRAVSP